MSEKTEVEVKKWMKAHTKKSLAMIVVNGQIALKREKDRADKASPKIANLQEKCRRGGEFMKKAAKQILNLEIELKGVSSDNRELLKELNYVRDALRVEIKNKKLMPF